MQAFFYCVAHVGEITLNDECVCRFSLLLKSIYFALANQKLGSKFTLWTTQHFIYGLDSVSLCLRLYNQTFCFALGLENLTLFFGFSNINISNFVALRG